MESGAPDTSTPPVVEAAHRGRALALLGAMFAASVIALFFGPKGQSFAAVGALVIPLSLLAVTSYAGEDSRGARLATLVILAALALLVASGFAAQAEQLLDARVASGGAGDRGEILQIWIVSLLGLGGSGLMLLASVRRGVARMAPIDPARFVHTVALFALVTVLASAFAPLVVLGEPPLTALVQSRDPATRVEPSSLYEHAYQLIWILPACLLLVGYGMRRTLSQCLERLGLVAPSLRQVGLAMLLAVGLGLVAIIAGWFITWAFQALGLPVTDKEGVDQLMGDIISPTGALVVGVSAGLGEELLVRGVLQPRLGIPLSNLLFTALHAGQYGWDFLAVIFIVGTAFGLVRKYTNTTMSAMVHGFYDILLIMATLGS